MRSLLLSRCVGPTGGYKIPETRSPNQLRSSNRFSLPIHRQVVKRQRLLSTSAIRNGSTANSSQQQVYILPIAGDGRCLFRALAQGNHLAKLHEQSVDLVLLPFEAETAQADKLRNELCDELLARKDDIAPFIDGDFEAYITRMRAVHTWGGEPEIAAATHVLQRPLSVFTKQRQALAPVSQYGVDEYSAKYGVPLLFHGGGHYELLVQGDIKAAPDSKL